jgi:hypothetical protein
MMTAAWGQTLQIPPVAVNRASANILRLIFTGRPDHPVSALQWELIVPRGLRIDAPDVVPGTAAESAGKSISCSNRPAPKDGKICVCVLIGGIQPIPDGAIAIVKFSTPGNAPKGKATVRMQNILGVSADLKKLPVPDSAGTITVQ